ncbi:MAG TPA: acyl-CoA dehydrogenase family protein [Candidatus Binataceae bacterium]|nr:acyl-CoA dehydrogenase family protein [Candidatus Binataceae bacterium]
MAADSKHAAIPPATGGESTAAEAAILARLVAAARELVPVLSERAARCEELRRLPDETFHDFRAAGFFRIFQPARYGGYELDYGFPQIEIAREIGRGCGSSAWVLTVMACHSWIVGMFPERAQDEVWGETPDAVAVTATFPEQARVESADGGIKLWGRWKFSSGVDHADWALIGAPGKRADGGFELLWTLVPRRDFEIIDTWFAGGLRGTGSKDVAMDGAFIPDHRIVTHSLLAQGQGPGGAINRKHIYRLQMFSIYPYNICAPALGIARGALEGYTARVSKQGPNAFGARSAEVETNQLKVSEAAVMIDAAETLLRRNARELNELARAGIALPLENRVRYRRDLAYAAQQCMRAVDLIHYIGGAHALFETNPIQRAFRDVHAVNAQIGLRWDIGALPYGRLALGLELHDPFL